MRKIYAILLILAFVFIDANSQEEDPKVGRGFDTWTIGVGVPNTIVQGDLSSINEVSSSFLNPSYYVYINKNFSPIFGVEVKGQYLNLVGYSEPFDTSIENIAYNSGENLVFTGDTFGGEFNFGTSTWEQYKWPLIIGGTILIGGIAYILTTAKK